MSRLVKFAHAPIVLALAGALAHAEPAPVGCGNPATAKAVADGFEKQVMLTDTDLKFNERIAQGRAEHQINQLVKAGKLTIAQRDAVVRDWLVDPRYKKIDAQKWAEMQQASAAAEQSRALRKQGDLKHACMQAEKSIRHFKRFNDHDGALYPVLVTMAKEAARKRKPK